MWYTIGDGIDWFSEGPRGLTVFEEAENSNAGLEGLADVLEAISLVTSLRCIFLIDSILYFLSKTIIVAFLSSQGPSFVASCSRLILG